MKGLNMTAIVVLGLLALGAWYISPVRPGSPYFIGPTQ